MRGIALTWAALIVAAGPARAQSRPDTLTLTLDQALERALSKGEEMRIARAQMQDANGQVREAFSQALPQINGSLTYTRQFASVFSSLGTNGQNDTSVTNLFKNSPFGAANAWNATITASQLLFSGGKVGAGLSAAHAVRQATTAQLNQSEADIRFQVKQAYYNAQYAERLLEVATSGLNQAKSQLHQVQLFQEQGTRSSYDLLRAKVDASNQEPVVVAAKTSYDVALLDLKRLTNVPADQPVALVTPLEATDGTIPVLAEDPVDTLVQPALAAADATVRVRQELVKVAKADRWPSLSLNSTFSEQAFPQDLSPFSATFRRDWNANVKLSVPIFTGFRISGSVDRAEAAVEEATAQRNQVAERIAQDLSQARADMERTRVLLLARHGTVEEAKQAQQLASLRYANGLSTQLEISDARLLAQQSEANEVQAARDYLVALAQYEKAMGRPVTTVRRPLAAMTAALNTQGNDR